MIVIYYDPPGEDPREWELDEGSWTVDEIVLLEKHSGQPRPKFFEAVAEGSVTARRLLLWVVRLRTEPNLSLGELGDLKVPYLFFGQTVEEEPGEPDAVNDPKDTPSGSEPEPDPSNTE